ncbi:transferase family protein [Coniochaeta ligniaria NRRL 30616]|uniref:Transferase family protein n=1 Tax=Coniochaeta ligniaria NRRL 30616 TaxID=1408157 RepID=A0A1J7IAR6_9PEZI|nr:transferase family protein [Coniochaeta ligniaria NRRL 30616]
MSPPIEVIVTKTERVLPETPTPSERAVPLSLLDATTADFALTQAIWLLERPQDVPPDFDLAHHLRQSLRTTLSAYPQWCGQCKAVSTLAGPTGAEARDFPPHARRFGRIYVHFGTGEDPGVEFVTATSPATLDALYPANRTEVMPAWNRREASLKAFSPPTAIHSTLQPNHPDENGLRKPLLAIQVTQLSCGGFVLAAKSAHPMADIAALVHLMKDWGNVSRALLSGEPIPRLSPVFDPAQVDDCAQGDINDDDYDEELVLASMCLPMSRFDWWAAGPVEGCPWPTSVPGIFRGQDLAPARDSIPMPWKHWDVSAPVSSYIIHLTRSQVDHLFEAAVRNPPGADTRVKVKGASVSKHDAVLAHMWSCVVRARQLSGRHETVYCNLVVGMRPVLGLGDDFIGSPVLMAAIDMYAHQVAAYDGDEFALRDVARRIRSVVRKLNDPSEIGCHLHALVFEKSPQRIWQAFLGRKHILVTSWARAGLYEVDLGLGSAVRYADDVVPDMDGCISIKEAPPAGEGVVDEGKRAWTDYGVDVSVALRAEDMERLLKDALLLPKV